MGLFDLFGSKEERERRELEKLAKRLTVKYGPPDGRQKAIAQLSDMGTPGALGTLCLRFTITSEPGITDQEEKESVRETLVAAGDRALGPLEAFLRRQEEGVGWALRALAGILPPDRMLAAVTNELGALGREYTREPDKKLLLLGWLVEHHEQAGAADVEGVLLPLLEDFSDDVRIAATRALAARPASPAARDALIELLLRDRDNARVRGEVFEALARLGADVKGHRPSVEAMIAEPYYLDREGQVKKRP
jgi:hypothetical protein